VLLVGDCAHVNNPIGGMGMNGGIHDAINLAEKLAEVWFGRAEASLLDRYTRQRRRRRSIMFKHRRSRTKRHSKKKTRRFAANI
jgi:2-polyprenyl-6-methoxyphenol hydroxylase-like FAD-dependent oxidoreductase